jgi:hypothetical protein
VQVGRDAVCLRLQSQLGLGGLLRVGGPGVTLDGLGHRVMAGGAARAAVAAQSGAFITPAAKAVAGEG